MDNKEINNTNLKSTSTDLHDYEIEISDKKGFLSSLLDKFKLNRTQKLLQSGNNIKTQTTNRSISSLWGFGNLRATLFNSLDTVRKAISQRFSPEPQPKNQLAVEIVSETYKENQQEKFLNDDTLQENRTPPIIPVVKNNIINNAKSAEQVRIEVAKIDTSAINGQGEKEASEKITGNKDGDSISKNNISSPVKPSSITNTVDERE